MLVGFIRASGKARDSVRLEIQKPLIEGCDDHIVHWGWSMILGKVIAKKGFCFVMGSIASIGHTIEDMVNILFPSTTVKALSVDTVVLGGSLM